MRSRTRDGAARTRTLRVGAVRGHVETGVVIGNVERVLAGMIGRGPVAPGVVEADQDAVLVLLHHRIPIDVRAPGIDVDVGDVEFRDVQRKRRGPEELTVGAVERPSAAGFYD